MANTCTHCKQPFDGVDKAHYLDCASYVFPLFLTLKDNEGPSVLVKRNTEGQLICCCLNEENIPCTQTFSTQRDLVNHLHVEGRTQWKVSCYFTAINLAH